MQHIGLGRRSNRTPRLGLPALEKRATRGWPNQSMFRGTARVDDAVNDSRRIPLARSSRGNGPVLRLVEVLRARLDDVDP